MEKRLRKSRVTEKNLGRKKRELSLVALEIAATAQEVIRQRMERALKRETELDSALESLIRCAEMAEDKAAAKSVLARFDAIKLEDISKVLSILKACTLAELESAEADEGESCKLKFEDMYG